jgi:hypothetical protein
VLQDEDVCLQREEALKAGTCSRGITSDSACVSMYFRAVPFMLWRAVTACVMCQSWLQCITISLGLSSRCPDGSVHTSVLIVWCGAWGCHGRIQEWLCRHHAMCLVEAPEAACLPRAKP